MLPLAIVLLQTSTQDVTFDYVPFKGLQVSVAGVPIVQGSTFQYFEDNWARGIYSSSWNPVDIVRETGKIRVRYQGDDGRVTGQMQFESIPSGVRATYDMRWRGNKPVRLEHNLAQIWAPAVDEGNVVVDGLDLGPPLRYPPAATSVEDRTFFRPAGTFRLETPKTIARVRVDPPGAVMFDARAEDTAWAQGRELFWLGFLNKRIEPQQTLTFTVEWTFEAKPIPAQAAASEELLLTPREAAIAAVPEPAKLPVLPAPKDMQQVVGEALPVSATFRYEGPDDAAVFAEEFEAQLWRLWARRPEELASEPVTLRAGIRDLGLPPEGYTLGVTPAGVELLGQDRKGLRHAFQTLAWLADSRNGRLVFPRVTVKDWPSVSRRGVHLFVGPTALDFHPRLMDRVLSPLKFNYAVLQCERANWAAIAGTENEQLTMDRHELAELFDRYRAEDIEPIPLIQSLGHMAWLFENGQNLDIALDPELPFTVDPRKERTREVLGGLWREAVDLLKPKTIHFGLDEFDHRGMPDDPFFSTRLWKRHVPWLMELSRELDVEPMMWGDMMLAPGEAVDATHASTPEQAAARRGVLPRGVQIADWHYPPNPNPDAYGSLDLWKREGQIPIAASWYEPLNIYGHTHAAIRVGGGTLQTTWAGFESSEHHMMNSFNQFAAFVLAGDYAWSGRTQLPSELGYDPDAVLRRLFVSPPSLVKSSPGWQMLNGEVVATPQIGTVQFNLFAPAKLRCAVSYAALNAPEEIVIPVGRKATQVALALDCHAWIMDGDEVAEVVIQLEDGREMTEIVKYGWQLRAPTDPRNTFRAPRLGSISSMQVWLSDTPVPVKRVVLRNRNPVCGLRLHGVTLF